MLRNLLKAIRLALEARGLIQCRAVSWDEEADAAIRELMPAFGVTSSTQAAVRRIVQFARTVCREADENGRLHILPPDGREAVVLLRE